ncbi:unnamed protein product, partial [Mesorhabditis spiculigera]
MHCAAYCSATGGRCLWMQTYFECSCKYLFWCRIHKAVQVISLQLSELPTPILIIVLTVILVAISLLVAIMICIV